MTPSAAGSTPAAAPPQDERSGEDAFPTDHDELAQEGDVTDASTITAAGARTPAVVGWWASMRERWPRRRVAVAALLAPALGVLLVDLGGGWGGPPAWTAVVATVALSSAATIATYVPLPGAGAKPDLGCTPCAAMAGFAVAAATLLVDSMPHDVATALLALAASAFALRQRLASPVTCPTPHR